MLGWLPHKDVTMIDTPVTHFINIVLNCVYIISLAFINSIVVSFLCVHLILYLTSMDWIRSSSWNGEYRIHVKCLLTQTCQFIVAHFPFTAKETGKKESFFKKGKLEARKVSDFLSSFELSRQREFHWIYIHTHSRNSICQSW